LSKKFEKRQRIITDRLFQLQLAYRITGVSFLGIVILTLFFFIMSQDIVSTLIIKYNIELDDPSKVLFLKHIPFSLGYLFIIGVVVVLQSMMIIRLTHRLAGPVSRFLECNQRDAGRRARYRYQVASVGSWNWFGR